MHICSHDAAVHVSFVDDDAAQIFSYSIAKFTSFRIVQAHVHLIWRTQNDVSVFERRGLFVFAHVLISGRSDAFSVPHCPAKLAIPQFYRTSQ